MKPFRKRAVCVYTQKIRYRDWISAQLGVEKLRGKDECVEGDRLNAYRCKHCMGWHIGHGKYPERDERT